MPSLYEEYQRRTAQNIRELEIEIAQRHRSRAQTTIYYDRDVLNAFRDVSSFAIDSRDIKKPNHKMGGTLL